MIRLGSLAAALMAVSFTAAGIASADPAVHSSEDETFHRLLTQGSDSVEPLTVTNFPLIRAQGLGVCQRQRQGYTGLEAVRMLQADGPYSFDTASAIASAAVVAYCREYLGY